MREVSAIIERLRAEYLEMPGLLLSATQVQRLCGIEPKMCEAVLASLVSAKFLRIARNGTYARLTDEPHITPTHANRLAGSVS